MEVETGLIALGAAASVFGGALGTAWSQSAIGSAGMGVLAEKPEQFTKVMLLVVIPETIVIIGFAIAYFLIQKIPAPVH